MFVKPLFLVVSYFECFIINDSGAYVSYSLFSFEQYVLLLSGGRGLNKQFTEDQ